RHTAALRMSRDESLTMRDVQTILGHAHLSTTADVYLVEDEAEVIRRVRQHLAAREQRVQQSALPPAAAGYDAGDLSVLFGGYPPGGHQEARAHRRAGLPADVPGRPARLRLPGCLPGERPARPGPRDHAARYVRPPGERRGRTRAERPRQGRRAVRDQQDRAA